MTRAERRNHLKRIEDRIRAYTNTWYFPKNDPDWQERYIKQHRQNRRSCSCWLCKRYALERVTFPEKKMREATAIELMDFDL